MGLGATIGSGIFVLTGTVAAEHTGPALTLSLLDRRIRLRASPRLCYSEFASFLPVSGSAYSYAYATLGEGIAWFIGWNLTLEYMLSASAVAVSWSGYVTNLLGDWGIHLPAAVRQCAARKGRRRRTSRLHRRHRQCAGGAHRRRA